jgi:hypothetical protein
MISVRGTFRNGCAQPEEAVEGREGQPVLITFLQDGTETSAPPDDVDAQWDVFLSALEQCQVDTGIPDLAHEHDHYLHGKPKKGS